MHTPVYLEQAIEALDIQQNGKYIDGTVGEGGHLQKILEKGGEVLAIDWDENQVKSLKSRLNDDQLLAEKVQNKQVIIVQGNYAEIERITKENNFYPVDGILLDFGLSISQIKQSGRGFSYQNLEDPLDMRISANAAITAQDVINSYSEEELYEIFAKYSEELFSRAISESIVRLRKIKKFSTVGELIHAIDEAIKDKDVRKQQTYARIFQALRIVVNDEFENIKKVLAGGISVLKPQGKLVIITFHSLEDRIVKQYTRQAGLKLVTKEINEKDKRKFERSAILRIISKF